MMHKVLPYKYGLAEEAISWSDCSKRAPEGLARLHLSKLPAWNCCDFFTGENSIDIPCLCSVSDVANS